MLLTSCGQAENSSQTGEDTTQAVEQNLETNIEEIMAELTGNVVIDVNHALA